MTMTHPEILQRWQKAWEARAHDVNRYKQINLWYYAFERHIDQGETWKEAYRFPELFGAVERKYDTIASVFPETKIRGDDDGAIAKQKALDHMKAKSNYEATMNRVLWDVPYFGMGILMAVPYRYERKIKTDKGEKDVTFFDGIGFERIDPRDIFPAPSAYKLHDHTGMENCPWLFRKRIYYYETFLQKYDKKPFDREAVKKVRPTTWDGGGWFDQKIPTLRESEEKEQSADYVTVMEYWDQELDMLQVYANSEKIYDSPDGIPYSHKQIPFHFYYNYRRYDSISGVSEITLIQPYNLFREQVVNLMIDNAKLGLQPAYIVDGDINFNEEEEELQPGAIFNVRGLDGGKLQDHIMPYRVGEVSSDAFNVLQVVDDSYISTTADDKRALQANPSQLATQTLAKQQALQQRILNTLTRNTAETQYYLDYQLCSYIMNEFAQPYENEEGEVGYRKIEIQGYQVAQDKDESAAEFTKDEKAESSFYLNGKVVEMMKDKEIEIVPARVDETARQDRYQSMMMALQAIFQAMNANPEGFQQVLGDMDVKEYVRQTFEDLKLDVKKIFPPKGMKKADYDIIDAEHDAMMMGENPGLQDGEDSMVHYEKHREFEQSKLYQEAGKAVKDAFDAHIMETIENIVNQKSNATQIQEASEAPPGQGIAGPPPQLSDQVSIQDMAQVAQETPGVGAEVAPPTPA